MLALWEAVGHATGRDEQFALGVPDPLPEVEPPMAAAFQQTISRLRSAGVKIRSVDLAGILTRLVDTSRTIMFYEGARFHEQRYKEYGARMADMGDLVREGLQISAAQYEGSRTFLDECRLKVAERFKETPVMLVPAATGPAPLGLSSTGDSRMNAPWTALGTPAITIPMPVGGALPLGLQLTAAHGEDARVIRTAVRLERLLGG
jgi:Asp-tRNA(Asn)/Glu-tRNA(Gln) amidotransferase A subunit family amidase